MRTLKAVSFDVGWTLTYPIESMWEIYARLCTESGVPTTAADCEQLVRSLWSSGQEQAHERFRNGASYSDSDAEFAGLFVQMSHMIFGRAGLGERLAELSQRFFEAFWNEGTWQLFPDTIEVLRELRARGLRVGVLSNAPSNLRDMLEHFGLLPHLDFAVISAIEGVKKPDRRIFERVLERAGVAPHEVLHVGDMFLEDVAGAGAAGIHSLLIERGERSLFPSFPESAGRSLPPGAVVRTLRDVVRAIDEQG
ncbi:MAG: HAD-IA family hydrolase [Deltaproteobacteria bacterium]|nr:HAD-IA family hydrolase [Deltaproteobacteria bacterium]